MKRKGGQEGKQPKKNKPSSRLPPTQWPDNVLDEAKSRLDANLNKKDEPYFVDHPISDNKHEVPPALQAEVCQHPRGAARITVNLNDFQYQSGIHRLRLLLRLRDEGKDWKSMQQASHLCPDYINVTGSGHQHCVNPDHMESEDDATNKSRQRCAGWIWIHQFEDHEAGYWYPSCVHDPPCKRFTPKTEVPTVLR